MGRRLASVSVLVLAAAVTAAPVPKSIKKKPASPDGTWVWTEFHSNGVAQDKRGDNTVWKLEGETFRIGANAWSLTIPDPDKPNSRRFSPPGGGGGAGYSAMVEVDGDELRFCYSGNQNETVTECKPAGNVYYYLFKRAADNGK